MLEFNEELHEYFLDGSRIPHVTQVTDLLTDYAAIPRATMEAAADRGTAVHLATQLWDDDDLDMDSLPDAVTPYVEAWAKFRRETGFVPAHIEYRVFSKTYRYAGTLDRTGIFTQMKGVKTTEPVLLDLKATYKIMAAVGPQTAGYLQAYREQVDAQIKRRFAVQLKADGTYRLEEFADPSDWSVFLSGLTILNWRQRHGS
jgi:hypothetical protein